MTQNAHETERFRPRDQKLLLFLASGLSIRRAAAKAKVSVKTVQRRLGDAGFRRELDRLRSQMVERALGKLAGAMAAASTTLRRLLQGNSETVRLGAARAILELHSRLKETAELENRLAEMEARLEQQNQQATHFQVVNNRRAAL